ncbi:hypothetical protein CEK00_09510 [Stenotrophomonas maltophilia]|uniref:Uncharacterized protein n=1 Tax=Stenotrophomonas maltophilia TaxID=40324 RepID=A0A270NIB7_STEMA|nr:hypothetical protein [Stenotrophomonas maltophilia]PAM64662.1 hypothetical protein CEK00_21830 [Stenotrophomonas maltophilia]PAM71819.1 hypothetical protein CEK00_09510 [Stenotrophomonas maltophilia]
MVNAVNSARAVPELGARRDNAPGQAESPLQDVRKEAARLIERHKRRMAEAGLVLTAPQRLQEDALMALRLKQAPVSPTPLVADGHDAQRLTTQTLLTTAVREAGVAQPESTRAAAEASQAPLIAPDAGQVDTEGRMPQHTADQARAVQSEEAREQVLAQPSQANMKLPGCDARGVPQPASTVPQHLRTSAVPLPLHATVASGEQRSGATVFDVQLRGLGAQHSTQVSLHLASGQVVLTPSSERAAEVLIPAAQATDWVSVGDASDERDTPQREQESDGEEEQ